MSRVRSTPVVVGIVVGALALVGLTVPPWVIPPIEATETGPAAIEMVQFKDGDRTLPYASLPEPLPAAEPYEGEAKASENYENVQVLGDLSDGEFTRTMLAITEWVAPEQGCEYCHNLEEGFASDSVYTKVVARKMLQMVRHINTTWPEHVAPSGVTCYTCHRGQNVPPWTWYEQNESDGGQFMGKPRPWHLEAATIRQFFPSVPYDRYLMDDHHNANIQSSSPLVGMEGASTEKEQDAENLYLFMMQMSNQMGINCTFCHNSRAFRDWSQSTPYRWIAYWGIRMARDINSDYIEPLASVFPDKRKGPLGDPAKVHCGTCHLGNNKPLGGYNLLQHYLAALTEDGTEPDPSQKQAILLGNAQPVAVNEPQPAGDDETPVAPAVNEKAVEQSVAPSNGEDSGGNGSDGGQTGEANSGGDADYQSQSQPGNAADDPTVGGTVTPVPDSGDDQVPSDAPTGAEAPQGAEPSQVSPNTPESAGGEGTANAPSMGQPASNPVSANDGDRSTTGESTSSPQTPDAAEEPAENGGTTAAEPEASTDGGEDASTEGADTSSDQPASPSKGPAQGTTTTFN